ncbi:PhzF family phenazine biosynthesis protein [Affinibrenneria salicis]|uniref:PhzF family phenazine biosynthesis protein n=1 Tax=Affinibrenneria salicis TaxID=2590031 RepID=A0A5J5FTM8_9GAMM|nr:PhzF family phenazine biosynthesis protein [Affinibrenneria salicis]KAA8996393.1 PhzF family phenazine biosynthesis protein [Affinibrenneria salicis]
MTQSLPENVLAVSAFSLGENGGNPAGVWLGEQFPTDCEMQGIAAAVGFSETVFACPQQDRWRVRYFSPESEVPFCGHATIALGFVLAERYGVGLYALQLNDGQITVEGSGGDAPRIVLRSPETRSEAAPDSLTDRTLALFGYRRDQLDGRLPPAIACGGARHLVLTLNQRQTLRDMAYDFSAVQQWMREQALTTIMLVWAEDERHFHVRNAFAGGGVYEDPATGAAGAAFAGYLRDVGWPHGGDISIRQGEDMGCPSAIRAEFSNLKGSPISISGMARWL